MCDLDFGGLGECEVLNKLYDSLVAKYKLGSDKKQNQMLLAEAGYVFGANIRGKVLEGLFVRTASIATSDNYLSTKKAVDTHKHGIYLLHSVDAIKTAISMQTAKVKTILERLFRKGGNMSKNLVALDTREFYAFVINNEYKLTQDFCAVTTGMAEQMSFVLKPKTTVFHIPEQDFFKYDPNVKNEVEYLSNAYHDDTSGFATNVVRSTLEMFFERHCEKRDDIEWVYKNGDSGQQYFSIVYIDGLRHQWLFYADYIVKKKDGTIWIIETKGGESKDKNKNIDDQIENKFYAFKDYAAQQSIQ